MKIILIGKMKSGANNNGPSAILEQLHMEFVKYQNIEYNPLFLTDRTPKILFICSLLRNLLMQKNIYVNVHTDGFFIAFIVYIISQINKKNIYYLTIHGIAKLEQSYVNHIKYQKLYLWIESTLCKKFDNVICVSEMEALDIRRLFKRNKKISVIGNSTLACKFYREKKAGTLNPITLISMGGINLRKGILELVELVDYLVNICKINCRVDVYGGVQDLETANKFELSIEKYGLSSVFQYKGMISVKEEVFTLLSKYDFSLCLSRYDTFNVSVIESMVMGCPVICSDRCGASFYVNKVDKKLIYDLENEKVSRKQVADLLLKAQSDHDFYKNMIHQSQAILAKVSPETMAESYIKTLRGDI